MIHDKRTEFCDATSVAQAAGTYLLGSQIDLGVARDIGNGRQVYLVITCDVAIITGGSPGTIQFALVSDDTESIHESTRSVHLLTKAYVTDDIALAECLAGKVLGVFPLPLDGVEPYEQFLGLQAIIATETVTAGQISAYLTLDPHGNKAYPNAI